MGSGLLRQEGKEGTEERANLKDPSIVFETLVPQLWAYQKNSDMKTGGQLGGNLFQV